MFEIIRSREESDRITNFVAIGNLIDDDTNSYHSAFIIQYEKIIYEFHYTGNSIEYEQVSDDYFHKITDTISSDEVPAFIALCKNIQKNANPTYGFFYSGESYDINGNHLSNDLGERMTCVGFCLNVLKGFLEEDYLVYTDWSNETHEDTDYLEKYCAKYGLDPSKIIISHRRITPRECLTSCYFEDLPIEKKKIDNKIIEVDDYFLRHFMNLNN